MVVLDSFFHNTHTMNKTIVILASILLSSTSLALAWDVAPKQQSYGNDTDNTPKSYTTYGDSYRNPKRDNQQDNRRQLNDYSRSSTRGSYETEHRGSTQINNNGLIINRE